MESSAPHSASGSSFAQNAQNPPKRGGVDLVVDAHAVPGAEFDFDDAGLVRRLLVAGCHGLAAPDPDSAAIAPISTGSKIESPGRLRRARQPSLVTSRLSQSCRRGNQRPSRQRLG